jgi:hypothetical protein
LPYARLTGCERLCDRFILFFLWLKGSLFPDGFFELRKKCKENVATPDEKSAFKLAKAELEEKILYLPAEEVFDVKYSIPAIDSDNDGVPDA